jgi:hypothetical protein
MTLGAVGSMGSANTINRNMLKPVGSPDARSRCCDFLEIQQIGIPDERVL